MNTCTSCGAQIIWALTGAGKRIPLDAKPEKRILYVAADNSATVVDTYQTHFVSCPKAAQHRKPRAS